MLSSSANLLVILEHKSVQNHWDLNMILWQAIVRLTDRPYDEETVACEQSPKWGIGRKEKSGGGMAASKKCP